MNTGEHTHKHTHTPMHDILHTHTHTNTHKQTHTHRIPEKLGPSIQCHLEFVPGTKRLSVLRWRLCVLFSIGTQSSEKRVICVPSEAVCIARIGG